MGPDNYGPRKSLRRMVSQRTHSSIWRYLLIERFLFVGNGVVTHRTKYEMFFVQRILWRYAVPGRRDVPRPR